MSLTLCSLFPVLLNEIIKNTSIWFSNYFSRTRVTFRTFVQCLKCLSEDKFKLEGKMRKGQTP